SLRQAVADRRRYAARRDRASMPWAKSQVNPASRTIFCAGRQHRRNTAAAYSRVGWNALLEVPRSPVAYGQKPPAPRRLFPLLFSRFHLRSDRLDFRCAEFEFRNFPEWIKRRIGQNIRGGLHVSEGDEHDTIRNSVILTRVELNSAATGGHAHHVSGLDPELHESAA